MVIPEAPSDPELQNIIEKLADFVARNGPEFEAYTKEKQRDNPKFAFLQGGEFYDYYQYKVDELRVRWQSQRQPHDNYQQQMDYGYQWNDSRSGANGVSWDQYGGGGGVGAGELGHHYPVPNAGGWGGDPDGQWYPPPWPGRPSFHGGPGMPGVNPAYIQPPHRGMSMHDGFNDGAYGMQGVPYGYNVPPNQGPSYQPPDFGYHGEAFEYPPTAGPAASDVPEFGESDIEQSEKNLEAQHEALMARQAMEIEELLDRSLMDSVQQRGTQSGLPLEQMNELIQPIIDSCTKENISKGKAWVIERGSESRDLAELLADYLLARAAARDSSFDLRLHLVYLLNDLLHHFKRRGAPNHLQDALQRVVPVMFCLTSELADEEKKTKLNRVLDLWDSNAYLPQDVLDQMRPHNMGSFMDKWKADHAKANEPGIEKIKKAIETEYKGLEQQHNEFADHVRQQLACSQQDNEQRQFDLNHQLDEPEYDRWGRGPPYGGYGDAPPPELPPGGYFMPPNMPGGPGYHPHGWTGGPRGSNWGPPPFSGGRSHYPPSEYGPSGGRMDSNVYIEGEENEPNYEHYYDRGYNQPDNYYRYDERGHGDSRGGDRSQPRRSGRPSRFSSASSRHDSSRDESEEPRHRQRSSQSTADRTDDRADPEVAPADLPCEPIDLEPKCPPWELPAGLMHSLIRLCDFDFTALDSTKLRLLPPKPPTERLMVAIDNFYLPPSHDRTRDGEGWERLGLYEFYSKKEKAREYIGKLKQSTAGSMSEHSSGGSRRRSRKQSGGSGVGSPSGDESQPDSAVPDFDTDCEHTKPFSRDSGGSRPTAFHLTHITAYPTAAIGRGIRTGLEALTSAPPPMHCMQGQLTHSYPNYKAVAPVVGPAGIAIPPPGLPGAPPGFPGPNFLQFPPPNMSQPPPPANLPPVLLNRSVSGPGYSANRNKFDSRRSHSTSKSRSGSRSGSDRSRSASRSRSGSRRSRSASRSRSPSSPSQSPKGEADKASGNEKKSSKSPRSRQRKRSRSHSRSSSPRARFTSAPGPGGIGPNSLSAARAAAMAVAASITNSINAAKGNPPAGSDRAPDGSSGGSSRFSGAPQVPPSGNYSQYPPIRNRSRSRFSSVVPNPSRVAEMHLLGEGPDER